MPHIHELYDFTVGMYIVFQDKVLLVNHPRYQQWLSPGGHIELDEDPEQAIYREVAEETRLTIELVNTKPELESPGTKFLPAPNYLDVHEANLPHHHIVLIYFCRSTNDQATLSAEHTELKWFTLSELSDARYNLSPAVQFYAQQALITAAA